jgi:hypothetical protein
MKDRTTQLIVILLGALIILTVYRGRFVTYTIPSVAVKSGTDWRLSTEFEVYGDGAIGVYSYLSPLRKCNRFDSTSISLQSRQNQAGDFRLMQFNKHLSNQKPEVLLNEICPGDSMGLSYVFEVPKGTDSLAAIFSWTDSTGISTNARIDLLRKTSFSFKRNDEPDILILLYPILWMAFGVLILAKLTKLIKD